MPLTVGIGQLGFFDLSRCYEGLDERGDPLVTVAAIVPFDSFRPKLTAALIKGLLRRNDAECKNLAGRKPWDEVAVFKALALHALQDQGLRHRVPGPTIRGKDRLRTRAAFAQTPYAEGKDE